MTTRAWVTSLLAVLAIFCLLSLAFYFLRDNPTPW